MPADLPDPDWPRTLEPHGPAETSPFRAGSTTIAVLPDTQYYVDCRSDHVEKQARFLVREKEARNVRVALQLGDITENNWRDEWAFVSGALGLLAPSVPLVLAPGNHDYGDNGTANHRKSLFSEFFDLDFARRGGLFVESKDEGSIENAFYELDLGRVKIGLLALEWSPRRSTVEWANDVLGRHPKHRTIVLTHAYLYHDDTRYDFAQKGETQKWNPLVYGTARIPDADEPHDGEMLWRELVSLHPGVFLTLNGHVLVDGTGLLTSTGKKGNRVHQMLVNYQMLDEGGLGYLRLLELYPDGKTLRVKTYSPTLDAFATAPDQDFSLAIDPPLWREAPAR